MIKKLEQIVEKVKKGKIKKLAVACGEDPHTIEAVGRASAEGIVKAVLTGDRDKIRNVAGKNKVDPDIFEIVHEPDKDKALWTAIALIREGRCGFLMKGLVDSSVYMHAILEEGKKGKIAPAAKPQGNAADYSHATIDDYKKNLPKEMPVVSHVSVIQLPTYSKLLIVSDIAVIPYPDLKMKMTMLNYTIDVAHRLDIEKPKAAIICAVEKVNLKMPPTVDASIISKMAERGQIKGAIVDGPLSLDVAVSKESKEIKGVTSEVAGDADIMIFPNIETGNVFFKTCTNLARGEIAAIVTGAFCPCILTSRADSEQSKFYSIALGALMAD